MLLAVFMLLLFFCSLAFAKLGGGLSFYCSTRQGPLLLSALVAKILFFLSLTRRETKRVHYLEQLCRCCCFFVIEGCMLFGFGEWWHLFSKIVIVGLCMGGWNTLFFFKAPPCFDVTHISCIVLRVFFSLPSLGFFSFESFPPRD